MKAILFDVDDTLYDLAGPFIKTYDKLYGNRYTVDKEKLFVRNRFRSDEVYDRSMSGEMTMEDMYAYRYQNAFADVGVSISREEALEFQRVYEKYQREIALSEKTREMLDYCKEHAIVGIITNGPTQHQWDKVNDLGLAAWIPKEHVFVSAQAGYAKPRREIFDLAAERLGISGKDACFVGDSFACDVTGAYGAGWHTIWMNHRGHKPLDNGAVPDYEVKGTEELFEVIKRMFP